jgi:hypothetical protein
MKSQNFKKAWYRQRGPNMDWHVSGSGGGAGPGYAWVALSVSDADGNPARWEMTIDEAAQMIGALKSGIEYASRMAEQFAGGKGGDA